jgi:putative ABC transport system permease protein
MRVGLRYLRHHPRQTALMIIGVMLGVAVMVAIDVANAAASRAFDLSTDAIAGKATHQIVGGPTGLDEAIYTRLRIEGGVRLAAPVVTDYVTSSQLGDRPIQLLGVDPFAEPPFRSYLLTGNAVRATGFGRETSPDDETGTGSLTAFLTRPGALLISEGLAREYGLAVGDPMALMVAGRQITGSVVGLLQPADSLSRRALDGLILADITTAQEITGRLGRLDGVDLILPEDDPSAAQDIARLLPSGAQIIPVAARTGALSQMTAAFRINLTALSLLALVVGMFLIYNSMTFSVVQRRPLFGTLRCLGVTPVEIGLLVLVEALAVGVFGSVLGLGLGLILGQGAVRLVTQTINDLYFVVTVRGTIVPVESLVKGVALGTVATFVSAVLPAWEAAAAPPRLTLVRSGIEHQARRAVPLTVLAGLSGLIAGGALLAITPAALSTALSTALRQLLGPASTAGAQSALTVSFAGIFLITVGFALLAPGVTLLLLRGAVPVTNRLFGVIGRLAPRSITGALSRTAVAIAALMVAVSVVIGVGLMVGSFRSTVVTWLGQTLWGDVYISAPSLTATRSAAPLDSALL